MLRICEDTHIYCAVLRGKSKKHIFEEEIQKKKMLDVVVNLRGTMGFRTLAYCVLDNEIHLMLEGKALEDIQQCLVRMQEQYEKAYFGLIKGEKGTLWRSSVIREIPVEWRAVRCCIRLHTLPVEKELVSRPEDYWWCSYNDYLGRKWLGLAEPDIILSWIDGDIRKAARVFRQKHQQKKFVRVRAGRT